MINRGLLGLTYIRTQRLFGNPTGSQSTISLRYNRLMTALPSEMAACSKWLLTQKTLIGKAVAAKKKSGCGAKPVYPRAERPDWPYFLFYVRCEVSFQRRIAGPPCSNPRIDLEAVERTRYFPKETGHLIQRAAIAREIWPLEKRAIVPLSLLIFERR